MGYSEQINCPYCNREICLDIEIETSSGEHRAHITATKIAHSRTPRAGYLFHEKTEGKG